MKITEVEVKHTSDITNQPKQKTNSDIPKTSWRKWYVFPRWDIAHIIVPETDDKQKYLNKIKPEDLICQSTFSGKHNITYWKYFKTPDDYAEEYPDPVDEEH